MDALVRKTVAVDGDEDVVAVKPDDSDQVVKVVVIAGCLRNPRRHLPPRTTIQPSELYAATHAIIDALER